MKVQSSGGKEIDANEESPDGRGNVDSLAVFVDIEAAGRDLFGFGGVTAVRSNAAVERDLGKKTWSGKRPDGMDGRKEEGLQRCR